MTPSLSIVISSPASSCRGISNSVGEASFGSGGMSVKLFLSSVAMSSTSFWSSWALETLPLSYSCGGCIGGAGGTSGAGLGARIGSGIIGELTEGTVVRLGAGIG